MSEKKFYAIVLLVSTLIAWSILTSGKGRDEERREQRGRAILREDCLEKISEIREMLYQYHKDYKSFPKNITDLRQHAQNHKFIFQCGACYDVNHTIFSTPTFEKTYDTNWGDFWKFSYAYVHSEQASTNDITLLAFCVGRHPDVHVLLRNGVINSVSIESFTSQYKVLATENVYYPTGHWTMRTGSKSTQ